MKQKKVHTLRSIFSILLILFFIIILVVSFILQNQVLYPKAAPIPEIPLAFSERVSTTLNEKTHDYKLFNVKAIDGYMLEAAYLPADKPSNDYVVLVHGITKNMFASLKFYPIYHDLDYNVIIYSQRNHGNNTPTFTTYGVQEKFDLHAVVESIEQQFGEIHTLGIHGVSMGAATALQYAALPNSTANFIISDCAYSSAVDEFQYRLEVEYPSLSWFPFVQTTRVLTQLTHQFNYDEANPLATIHTVSVPIFFIHGLSDDYILPEMSQQLYNAKTDGFRDIWFVEHANHDDALETAPNEYEKKIQEFLNTIKNE